MDDSATWRTRVTFHDDDVPEYFDLGADEDVARELFREQRKAFERAKNDPAAAPKHLFFGAHGYPAERVMLVELVEPGAHTGAQAP